MQEALLYGYEHWPQIANLTNPLGYLFRVGQSRTRSRRSRSLVERWGAAEAVVEPKLSDLLRGLSVSQRTVVVLVHGYGWTHAEVAELLAVSSSTVQTHLERALARLRDGLAVNDER